jgi:glycosyltransferase involved in cell wall biosynthesis
MRVLLLADLCNPDWPSLPVVGYNTARSIADHADAVIVTQVRNRENLERVGGVGRAEVVYLDTEKIAAPIYKAAVALRRGTATGWTLQMAMDYPSYVAFELAAWRRLRGELAAKRFDVVHRITPMSPTLPSPMARLSPVPFVLGPLNGNLPWPSGFGAELRREREWLSYLRNAHKLLPFSRTTYTRAAAVLAAFDHTLADLPASVRDRAINFPEVGIDPAVFSAPERPKRERLTVLYAGRLVPYKLPEVVVRAFAASPALRRHRLVVAGDGPERPRLEAIVREHGLEGCVELVGQKTQAQIGALMRDAEIFAFPSIRELGAGVVVEAMACGMACVVVDYGGPATLIGPDRGVKVPLADKDALVARFAAELDALVADPDRTARLGAAAHAHAMDHYAWDVKARKTLEIYEWVLGRRSERPDFWTRVPAAAAA